MDLLLFNPTEYHRLYNCSLYNVDQIPLEQREHVALGLMFLILGLALEILYIPCAIVLWKQMENACYKIMFYIAIADMLAMLMNGIMTGYLAIIGAVYCTNPTLTYVLGAYGMSLWGAETMAEIILAFNRCTEICSPRFADYLFKGKRTWLWLLLPSIYGIYWFLCTEPHVFSAIYVSWFFNPHVGYIPDFGQMYYNNWHDYHNYFVIGVLSSTYITFSILLMIKTHKFPSQQIYETQKMTFIQVMLISSINAIAAAIYVYMQFHAISPFLIIIGQLSWLFAHGIPPIIYLTLNKTIRNDCFKLVARLLGQMPTETTLIRIQQQQQVTAGGGADKTWLHRTTTRKTTFGGASNGGVGAGIRSIRVVPSITNGNNS